MAKNHVIACAIIKNEPNFAKTLGSLREAVGANLAAVVVHDTGSADAEEIPFILGAFQSATGVPSVCYERPFYDFSSARNACLNSAAIHARRARAGWLFMFSAGATFEGKWAPPKKPRFDALRHTERLGDFEYPKICTISARSKLRFDGLTHEAIDAGTPAHELPHCGLIVDYSGDWDPEKKAERWRQDIALLADDYSPRGRFYLAQSFRCLGIYNEAFAYAMIRLEQHGYELERRQAAVYAVETAPTIRLARFAATFAPDCADVQLALAERELREKNLPEVSRAIMLATTLEDRAMFANTKLYSRCAEIQEMLK